jgi:hypothetical protein
MERSLKIFQERELQEAYVYASQGGRRKDQPRPRS